MNTNEIIINYGINMLCCLDILVNFFCHMILFICLSLDLNLLSQLGKTNDFNWNLWFS